MWVPHLNMYQACIRFCKDGHNAPCAPFLHICEPAMHRSVMHIHIKQVATLQCTQSCVAWICLHLQNSKCAHRAFTLEGRGIWHALSASITQQVIGPVRARADFRYALDLPSSIPQVSHPCPSCICLSASDVAWTHGVAITKHTVQQHSQAASRLHCVGVSLRLCTSSENNFIACL